MTDPFDDTWDITDSPRRLNFGCGSVVAEGWVNVDKDLHPGADLADITQAPLPYLEDRFAYVVANHSLSDLTHHELGPALRELRRLLTPGGVLRILVPDLIAAVRAWERDEPDWFPLGDDLPTVDERLCCFVPWFGTVGSVWTAGYAVTLLRAAGFDQAQRVPIHKTRLCDDPAICELDDRDDQALVIEAR